MGKKQMGKWKNFYAKRVTNSITQKRKVKRTLKSQGYNAAHALAKKFGISGYLEALTRKEKANG